MSPEILFENNDVLVINKPAGMITHPDGKTEAPSVAEWFVARCPEARGVGEPQSAANGDALERSGIVHRLDRETSGVLILAKTQHAYEHLKAQFHDRHAKKEYRALTHGYFKNITGTISLPIGRSRVDPRIRVANAKASGALRAARTDWKLLTQTSEYAYLALFPHTGRTHQIRVHLKAINHPVVGDTLYNAKEKSSAGLMLHAYRLTLTLPDSTLRTFEAPLPARLIEEAQVLGIDTAHLA